MNKITLTSEKAQQIQNQIYHNMSDENKIRIVSQFFMLGKELTKTKSNDTRRTNKKNR
jgi:hypothetical protein